MMQPGDIGVVLLAAGLSRRFGPNDKLLARLSDQPLAIHAAQAIAAFRPARKIAVCTPGEVAAMLGDAGFEVVLNHDPALGLSSSLAIGADACADMPAMMICLADMPFVSAAHLQALATACDPVSAPVICSMADGARMPPAIFARSAYAQIGHAQGDTGARAMLADALAIEAPAGELADIDRPEDLPD